ncbi:glutaredoxin-3-like [Planococcus citri]|uniref:glutaredoxin-3-like n=1 Tax=Planococcus citri TaxID=170843 RepID=UPI0031FA0162
MVLINVTNLNEIHEPQKDKVVVLFFYVDWSDECKNIDKVLEALSGLPEYNYVTFKKCAAEDYPEISLKFNVTAVPTIIFFKNGSQFDQLTGADPAALNEKLQQFVKKDAQKHPEQPLVISSDLVVICVEGGDPASEELSTILNNAKIQYKTFDVKSDESVKQNLLTVSGPFPQLYIKGEFVGNLDKVKNMYKGELEARYEAAQKGLSTSLVSRLISLINKSKRMAFIKGEKETPRCKFSKELRELLKETNVDYDTFDILSDEDVRQGLKEFTEWPTYPQIYVNGEFIGGVDIIKQLKSTGQLLKALDA